MKQKGNCGLIVEDFSILKRQPRQEKGFQKSFRYDFWDL